jgi:integrase
VSNVYSRKGRRRYYYKVKLADGTWKERVGFTDRRATEEQAVREQREIDRAEVGLVDAYRSTREARLQDLVRAFVDSLAARRRAGRYVTGIKEQLALVLQVTGARTLPDLTMQAIEAFLARLVRGELPATRRLTGDGRRVLRKPASMVTRDRYVEAIRGFGAWLVASDRWAAHPWSRLRREARESDRTMQHRALTADELQRLTDVAEVRCVQQWVRGSAKGGGHKNADPRLVDRIRAQGWARGTLYLFAGYTGLRLNECRQLRRGDLVLDGTEPHVVVRAATAKNRREQRVPLVHGVVERMREHLRRQSAAALATEGRILDASAPVFLFTRGDSLRQALRKDAEFAGIGLHNDAGHRLTFHGFRASTATLLARAGVSVAVAMRVMRHSNADLTLKVYAKLGLADAHLELLKLGVATKVSPRIAESLAAVGQSGPAFVAVESATDSAQGEKAAALVSSLASVGRRGPAAGDGEEMVGRAGLEPATSTL